MAYDTTNYHSNNVPGEVDLARFSIRDSTAQPKHALGTRVSLSDGRVFRYAQFGTATTASRLVAVGSDSVLNAAATTGVGVLAPVSSNTTTDGTAGQKFIQFTLAGMTLNQLAGGYFHTADGAGEGYTYRIKGNTATSGPAAGDIRIELYENIEVEVGSGTLTFLMGSLYSNLKECDVSGTESQIAGVTTAYHAANTYGWVQTWGPGSVEAGSAALVVNSILVADTATQGALMPLQGGVTAPATASYDVPIIASAMNTAIASDHVLANLRISP